MRFSGDTERDVFYSIILSLKRGRDNSGRVAGGSSCPLEQKWSSVKNDQMTRKKLFDGAQEDCDENVA